MTQTLNSLLRQQAEKLGDKTCVITPDGQVKLSYSGLHQAADEFALNLLNQGCQSGDTIILGLCNSPDFFIALFACFKGGFIAAPVDASLANSELEVIAGHARPSMIIADSVSASIFNNLKLTCPVIEVDIDRAGDSTVQDAAGIDTDGSITPDSPALLLYTSGTTGNPKGVLYSHAHLVHKMKAISEHFGFDESFNTLCLLPTHFGHGLICNSLPVFFYGGTLVITPPFNLDLISQLWPLVDTHAINTFSTVPAVLRLLLRLTGKNRTHAKHGSTDHASTDHSSINQSLKFITCASAPLWPDEIEHMQASLGVPILNCYGLTEAAGWISCSENKPDRNLASVGKAIGGEIRAVGSDGKVKPAGEVGELQVKGPSVMSGYYRHDHSTAQVSDDGWLFTGDLGLVDDAGAVFLHSRVKEIIIRAGKNIFPAEIDRILMSHPDVLDACTVGLDDPLMGEKVAACVVLKERAQLEAQELISHAQKSLAAYKCPQQILFVSSIRKTSRGKVNRSHLKSLFT